MRGAAASATRDALYTQQSWSKDQQVPDDVARMVGEETCLGAAQELLNMAGPDSEGFAALRPLAGDFGDPSTVLWLKDGTTVDTRYPEHQNGKSYRHHNNNLSELKMPAKETAVQPGVNGQAMVTPNTTLNTAGTRKTGDSGPSKNVSTECTECPNVDGH